MKAKLFILSLLLLTSVTLFARQRDTVIVGDGYHYVGKWPEGKGVLYSTKAGLVMGEFVKAVPQGECVGYWPDGELYWGQYRKGKATGYGRLFRDNGIVFLGTFKNGKYHGIDTLYRRDGSVYIGEFKNGKLKNTVATYKSAPKDIADRKPAYPRIDHKDRHLAFLKNMELEWDAKNAAARKKVGMTNPEFQGGNLSDFTSWVNAQIDYSVVPEMTEGVRAVIVEFVVGRDGVVRDVKPIFGTHPELNAEAIRVVKKSPKWKPAEIGGEKKNVKLSVPVVFEF